MTPDVFKPGNGAFPPALTGRQREQAVLTRPLADLPAAKPAPHGRHLTDRSGGVPARQGCVVVSLGDHRERKRSEARGTASR